MSPSSSCLSQQPRNNCSPLALPAAGVLVPRAGAAIALVCWCLLLSRQCTWFTPEQSLQLTFKLQLYWYRAPVSRQEGLAGLHRIAWERSTTKQRQKCSRCVQKPSSGRRFPVRVRGQCMPSASRGASRCANAGRPRGAGGAASQWTPRGPTPGQNQLHGNVQQSLKLLSTQTGLHAGGPGDGPPHRA